MIWKSQECMKQLTEEHKNKIRLSRLGKKRPPFSEEWIRKMSVTRKGRPSPMKGHKHSEETKRKMSEARRGEKNANWKGGITPINLAIRMSKEYKLWRQAVFERDNFTCIWCGQLRESIEADHIKPFSQYPELRFAIDNGRTLCRKCHETTETHGRRKKTLGDNPA